MPIVALTREYGSGGTDISMKVAERLGYEYVRDQVTREAAEVFGVSEDELIAVVERKPGFWESLAEAARAKLRDLSLEARIKAVLRSERETMRLDLNIASEDGHVKLTGMVFSTPAKDSVEKLVRGVTGVRSVKNEIRVYREW